MVQGNLTNLRKFFIIKTLLDSEKWYTQDIIKAVNTLHMQYIIRNQRRNKADKAELNHINGKEDHESLTQSKRLKINDAKISPILNSLVEEGIITFESIPKKEKMGRGRGGYRYWLVKDIINYFNVLKEFNKIYNKDLFLFYGLEFIKSPFGEFFLNLKIFASLESNLEVTIDTRIKEYILSIVKMSPNALLKLGKALYMSSMPIDLDKNEFPEEIAHSSENSLIREIIIKNILISLTNSFTVDISNSSIKNLSNTPFKSFEQLKVKNVLVLTGLDGDKHWVEIDLNKNGKNIKLE